MTRLHYGGDYNPEQWPRDVWAEDARMIGALSMDVVTLGVFDWALIQGPDESYDFGVLDEVIEHAESMGLGICLATATGAHPPWAAYKYPDVTRVDFEGRRHLFGQRHNSCPSSPNFKRLSTALAGEIARRYKDHESIVAWHVGNEYGGACYCENCAAAFRVWLRERYGSLDRLNEAWYTTFWSHVFTEWEEIVVPSALSEHWNGPRHTAFQGITLDYRRFFSDALLASFTAERDAIRDAGATQPVTTNMMGLYGPLDYSRWAKEMDFVSWDNYPPDANSQARMALTHDLTRGLKGGDPFWVMEQTPSVTACRDENPVKRPGVLRLWTYQAIAHGADATLFFQIRQCRGASEKYHGAVVGHGGRDDTRVFRECAELGRELAGLGEIVGARTTSRVALLFDWPSWWAVDLSDGPSRHLDYRQLAIDYYTPWFDRGVSVDVIFAESELTPYDIVLAPGLHMMSEGFGARVEEYVAGGGRFVASVMSGLVDEDDLAHLLPGPGVLGKVMGIRIDETDSQPVGHVNAVAFSGRTSAEADGTRETVCESRLVFDVIQREGAESVAEYRDDFYAGSSAVTRNRYGKGSGWYVGTVLDAAGMAELVDLIADDCDIDMRRPDGVEKAVRSIEVDGREMSFEFWLNHSGELREIVVGGGIELLSGRRYRGGEVLELGPAEVAIMRRSTDSASDGETSRARFARV